VNPGDVQLKVLNGAKECYFCAIVSVIYGHYGYEQDGFILW